MDESVASTTELCVVPPVAASTVLERVVPVALVVKTKDVPPMTVEVDGRAVPVLSVAESSEMMAHALVALTLAADPSIRAGTSFLEAIREAVEFGDPQSGDSLKTTLTTFGAHGAATWLGIALSYRLVMISVPSELAGRRCAVRMFVELPTITVTANGGQRISAALGRGGIPATIHRPLITPFASSWHAPRVRLPYGIGHLPGDVPDTSTLGDDLTMQLRVDRPGLLAMLRFFAAGCTLLLVASSVFAGSLRGWGTEVGLASPVVLIAPGLVLSTYLRPEMGRLLRRFLAPLQCLALATCALPAAGMAVLVSHEASTWMARGCLVLSIAAGAFAMGLKPHPDEPTRAAVRCRLPRIRLRRRKQSSLNSEEKRLQLPAPQLPECQSLAVDIFRRIESQKFDLTSSTLDERRVRLVQPRRALES